VLIKVGGNNLIKYQVFISSTYEDLKDERDQVMKAVLEMGHMPVGMEMFSAGDESQWSLIKRQLEDVDYYIVIIAHRYGSIDDTGVSYTEKEYDHAVSLGIPIIGLIIDDAASWPKKKMDEDPLLQTKLNNFKSKVRTKMVSFWKNKEDLNGKSAIALGKEINRSPRIGWVKGDTVASADMAKEITRLSVENNELRKETLKKSNIEEKEEAKIDEALDILSTTKVKVFHWKKDGKDWEKEITMPLLDIFKTLAPKIQVELDFASLNYDLAFEFFDQNIRSKSPLPRNYLTDWLADFSALNLIMPSQIRHQVSDTKQYWSITPFGNKVFSRFRFYLLKTGKSSIQDENPSD